MLSVYVTAIAILLNAKEQRNVYRKAPLAFSGDKLL